MLCLKGDIPGSKYIYSVYMFGLFTELCDIMKLVLQIIYDII